MIELSCTCGKKIKVPDTMAGKKGKCPGCGSVIDIVAPAPVAAAKKDDLLLELDDAPRKQVPMEAILPPSQELPDAPGAKKKPAAPRLSNFDLIGDEKPRPKKAAPLQPGEVAAKISCPQCGEKYDADVLFCMKCKVDIATGKAISGLVGTQKKANRPGDEFDPDLPFWKITLGMLYKPGTMMTYFASWFERKDVQAQMIGFYLISFLALAIAAGGMSGKEKSLEVKGPSDAEQIAKIEAGATQVKQHTPEGWTKSGEPGLEANDKKPFVFRVNAPVGQVDSGETFTVKFSFCEPGPGKGIDGDAYLVATQRWKGERQEFTETVPARSAGQPGDYVAEIDAEEGPGTSYEVLLYDKGADIGESGVKPRSTVHLSWVSKPGWAKQIYDRLGGTEATKKQSVEEEAAKLERKKGRLVAPTEWTRAYDTRTGRVGQIGEFYWKTEGAPTEGEAGKKFLITLLLALEQDKAAGPPVDAEVYVLVFGDDADDDRQDKAPKAQAVGPGKYQYEVTAAFDRATEIMFMFGPKGQELTGNNHQGTVIVSIPTKAGWARTVVERQRQAFEKEHENEKPSTSKGTLKKALVGAGAVVGAILANILSLLITCGVCFAAARLLGGGGSFLLLLCTLAYVTGFINILELAVFAVPAKDVGWVKWVIGGVTALAHLLALMKVFDLDFLTALLAAAIARLIVLFLVTWLVLAALGTSMMMAS